LEGLKSRGRVGWDIIFIKTDATILLAFLLNNVKGIMIG